MYLFSCRWSLNIAVMLGTVFMDTLLCRRPVLSWMLCEWTLAAPATVTVSSQDFRGHQCPWKGKRTKAFACFYSLEKLMFAVFCCCAAKYQAIVRPEINQTAVMWMRYCSFLPLQTSTEEINTPACNGNINASLSATEKHFAGVGMLRWGAVLELHWSAAKSLPSPSSSCILS